MNNKSNEIKSGVTMGSDYWISYTDIMTALLFIFILITFLFMFNFKSMIFDYQEMKNQLKVLDSLSKGNKNFLNEFNRLTAENNKLKDLNDKVMVKNIELLRENRRIKQENYDISRKYQSENKELTELREMISKDSEADQFIDKLLQELRDELISNNIKVYLDETNKTLNIDSTVVGFESGKYEIREREYLRRVNIIANLLKNKIDDDARKNIDAIFIEGYTDDVPLPKLDTFGNWGLSALRAISFWDSLNKSLMNNRNGDLSKIKSADDKKLLFSVSGYANVRPVDCHDFFYYDSCINYQECMLEDIENYELCKTIHFNSSNADYFENYYNSKNRRIGIRFIPYHRIDTKKYN